MQCVSKDPRPRMPQKASINTELLMRFCQRKVRKAKVFSNIIGVEESLVSYVTIKLTKKYRSFVFVVFVFVLHGRVPTCHPGMHALQKKKKRHKPGLGRYVLVL